MPTESERREPGTPVRRGVISRRQFVSRGIGLGIAATGIGSVLAACTDDEPGGPAGAVKGPATTPRKDVLYPDGYVGPIASDKAVITKEPVTLKVAVVQDSSVGDWAENAFTKWYEQRTNVRVEWQVLAAEDTMTKVNAMIGAGDLPDGFLYVGFSPAQELLYGSQGLFLPLNKYLNEYAVETQRIFKDYPDAKQLITSTDGNIYSMPDLNDCFHCSAGAARTWIYKPWLDKLGLSVPRTLPEFEEVLKAFKSRDPNGNGKADEIPLMGYSWEGLDAYFMGAFLYNPGTPWLVLDGDKVDVTFNKPGFREGLRYLNKLFAQGLLPRATFTQDQEQFQRVGNSGTPVLGVARAFYQGSFLTIDAADSKARWKDYVTVPVLAGPDGTRVAPWNYYGSVQTGRFVVTRACKTPEIAVMWADGQYELESVVRSNAGVLGEDWKWATQGEKGLTGKQAVWNATSVYDSEKLKGRTWVGKGCGYRSTDFRSAQAVVDPSNPTFEQPLHEYTERDYFAYKQDKSKQLPPLSPTEDQAARIGELQTTINNHVNQMMAKFIVGEADINKDADWSNYTGTLDRMGLSTYLQIHQVAYEQKYKGK